LCFGPACQPDHDPETVEDETPIVGGTLDRGDPAVLGLFAAVPGMDRGALCTAELVSPHVLLTAAHCVSPAEVGKGAQFRAFAGSSLPDATGSSWLGVKAVHAHPRFDPRRPELGFDIGVAVLAQPLHTTPLRVNRGSLSEAITGKRVRIVGFGLNDPEEQSGAGVKRQATTTIDGVDDRLIQLGDPRHDTCNGDSGGPALSKVNGSEVIIGVTSFGASDCSGQGSDTRVDRYLDFLGPYLE
jgi:secreted trypsin-like serine protease